MRLKDYITEYVSSGRGHSTTLSNIRNYSTVGKDIDSITEWLSSCGVEEFREWTGHTYDIRTGSVVAEIGPKGSRQTTWVALRSKPEGSRTTQSIIASIWANSTISDGFGNSKYISFEQALEYMAKMLEEPEKLIQIYQ